jgi:hypothetical protein
MSKHVSLKAAHNGQVFRLSDVIRNQSRDGWSASFLDHACRAIDGNGPPASLAPQGEAGKSASKRSQPKLKPQHQTAIKPRRSLDRNGIAAKGVLSGSVQ